MWYQATFNFGEVNWNAHETSIKKMTRTRVASNPSQESSILLSFYIDIEKKIKEKHKCI